VSFDLTVADPERLPAKVDALFNIYTSHPYIIAVQVSFQNI